MPSFSIEVAGEANPLTEQTLIQGLSSAASTNTQQIQSGTKQLQQWETTPGYYKHLQSAYLDFRLPHEVRYLAIIQLKNGIDKYWRKTALNAVPKFDKDAIRERLLDSILQEPQDLLAVQNALVIAKIARFEYPQDWPDLLRSLAQVLRSQAPSQTIYRALLALRHIVKELATGRLQRTRQNLQAATPELVHVLGTLYASSFEEWNGTSPDLTRLTTGLEALRILRRLLISGYEHPNRASEVSSLWQLTHNHLGLLINISNSNSTNAGFGEKFVVQLAKLHCDMAQDHPAAFALLPGSLTLVRAYWDLIKGFGEVFGSTQAVASAISSAKIGHDGDADEGKPGPEKLCLKGLLIIRACVKMVHNPTQTFKYRTPEDKQEKTQATAIVRQELLQSAFIQDAMNILVTRFFVFRARDLREWEEEPEEWEKREEGDGEDWEFSVRSCSEKLFLDIAINYKGMLVQPLLQVFYSVASLQNEDILFKDSVYTAIGLAAPVLHEHLDFDAFIRDVLIHEVTKEKAGFNILRRRAAILLGQWISVKISETQRPAVYQIFDHLLNKDDPLNDQVVRVTAGRQLKNICESWEFSPEQFVPFVPTTIQRLTDLIGEVESVETKMALLNTLSVLIENLDRQISPFASRIVEMLPHLWDAAGDTHLMKQSILTVLSRIVTALKAESVPLHSLIAPIIIGAVKPHSETSIYLLDDAMELWHSMLIQSPSPADLTVLQLQPYLIGLYDTGGENLRKALEITDSYMLLAPEYVLNAEVRQPTFEKLNSLLGTLKPQANGMVCNLLELYIRLAERIDGGSQLAGLTQDFVQSDLLVSLLGGLKESWTAHCTTGPNRKGTSVDGLVETDYLSILARIIMASVTGFCQSVEYVATSLQPNEQASLASVMQWLLEEWFSHFENVGDPSRRKLMCLGLTKLLETAQPWILLNLQSLMTIWTDVITELRESEEDSTSDSLVYNKDSLAQAKNGYAAIESPEDVRRREIMAADEIHTINLPAFVKETLSRTVQAVGGEAVFQQEWIVNVDRDILDGFVKLGVM